MKKLMFLVTTPPFKTENTRQAMLHAVGCYTVMDEEIEPITAFVGKGVLNCVTGQEALKFYGIGSNADEIKNLLLSDAAVLACREDAEKYGITDRIVDAKEFDAEVEVNLVPFERIREEMEECHQLLVF